MKFPKYLVLIKGKNTNISPYERHDSTDNENNNVSPDRKHINSPC
jgi:hypothetical protein